MAIETDDISSVSQFEPSFACEGWRSLTGLVWFSLLGAFAAMQQPIFLGAVADLFSYDAQQLGLLGGAELGGAGLASLAAIYWFPRVNLRKIALFALLVAIAGNVATGWVSQFPQLLLLRFLIGFFGSGVIYALSLGLIGQTRDPDRMVAFAVILQIAALAISMFYMPTLLARWQLSGMTLTISLVLCSGLFLLPLLPSRPIPSRPDNVVTKGGGRRKILPVGLLFGLVLFSVGLSGLWAFVERIGNHAGFSASDIGGMLAVGSIVGGLGALLAAIMGQRFGRLIPLVISIAGMMAVSLLLGAISDRTSYFVAVSLFNFFWNLSLPYLMGAIAQADSSGRFMVLIPAAQGAGYAAGPVLTGWFILEGGYAGAGVVSALVFMACLIVVVSLLFKLRLSSAAKHSANQ